MIRSRRPPAILLALPLLLAAVSLHPEDAAWVQPVGGLRMRNMPSLAGGTVVVIPGGTRVTLLETEEAELTIGGVTGRWTRVLWSGGSGWVFGGYLGPEQPVAARESALDTLPPVWIPVEQVGGAFTAAKRCTDGRYRVVTVERGAASYLVVDTLEAVTRLMIVSVSLTSTGASLEVKTTAGGQRQVELVWVENPRLAAWRDTVATGALLCLDARYWAEIRWIPTGECD